MEEEIIKTITIRENPYELIQLGDIIDKLEYFDEVVKTLKEEGEVVYRDTKIIYKHRDGRSVFNFIWYDDDSLPIRHYNNVKDLSHDIKIAVQTIRGIMSEKKTNILRFKNVEGFVEAFENPISQEEVERRRVKYNKAYNDKKKRKKSNIKERKNII